MRLPQARLDQVLDRFREIEARMGAASDGAEIVRLSKEHAELKRDQIHAYGKDNLEGSKGSMWSTIEAVE